MAPNVVQRPGTRRPAQARRAAFTLIETALATVIVGVGVLAMVAAQQAFHQQNNWSTHASIAERLGNEIREMSLLLPRHDPVTGNATWGPETSETSWEDYDDVDDFDGAGGGLIFGADHDAGTADNGPLNARREIIPNMNGWEQIVTVRNVDPFFINDVGSPPADGTTDMMLVEVLVRYTDRKGNQTDMTTVSWIVPK